MSDLDRARAVADAVLYEGYLLYPYRSTSSKNQMRWQFGMLGPAGAAEAGAGEESGMRATLLIEPEPGTEPQSGDASQSGAEPQAGNASQSGT